MPELAEQMYCHQQICIPPTFPYLLRQYAKAAIRSQPIDLLKWSTAYFRCLSLNIPPPIKPRLEYPIPRDYVGVTPGWLRALNYQLQNNRTVPFRILWDRWIGSCLQHETLIKILCLGGFTDNMAVPWNRFMGLCAGHLTDNLTQTMIMVCEILTEEPEGGSAMVPLETILDVYKFLAAIDASQPQTLINLYFTDAALNLYEKEKKKAAKAGSIEEAGTVESSTPTAEETFEERASEIMEMGEGSIISCPDIIVDDALVEPDLADEQIREEESDALLPHKDDEDSTTGDDDVDSNIDEVSKPSLEEGEEKVEGGEDEETRKDAGEETGEDMKEEGEGQEDERDQQEEQLRGEDDFSGLDDDESMDVRKSVSHQLKKIETDVLEKGGIELDEEHQHAKHEGEGESISGEDTALRGMTATTEEMPGEGGFYRGLDELEQHIKAKYQDVSVGDDLGQELLGEEEEAPEEVYVDIIPGIGPIVPQNLVDAVIRHLTTVSAEEHGMTMPRHIRHYTCPPLEVQKL